MNTELYETCRPIVTRWLQTYSSCQYDSQVDKPAQASTILHNTYDCAHVVHEQSIQSLDDNNCLAKRHRGPGGGIGNVATVSIASIVRQPESVSGNRNENYRVWRSVKHFRNGSIWMKSEMLWWNIAVNKTGPWELHYVTMPRSSIKQFHHNALASLYTHRFCMLKCTSQLQKPIIRNRFWYFCS